MNDMNYNSQRKSFSPYNLPEETNPIGANIHKPSLKVMGLGGGGTNAINRMIELGLSGVDFIAANTDAQALKNSLAGTKIQLGPRTTRGLGAGGNPEVGENAAEESSRLIAAALEGADMVFLTAGMGGGTGTGSIPVAAKIARSIGAVTIAVVTTPFSFEMGRRQRNASEGIKKLSPNADTLIAIPNDRLLDVAPRDLPLDTAFRLADDVLRQAVQGITELITTPGLINVDFANVRNLMKLGGGALMSIGQGDGEDKAMKAVEQALHHPLLQSTSIGNAAGILVNFTSGGELGLHDVQAALSYLQAQAGGRAEIVMGVVNDQRLQDRVEVILVVTGLGSTTLEETLSRLDVRRAPAVEHKPLPNPAPDFYEMKPQFLPEEYLEDELSISTSDLDIPAFLRRGRRISIKTSG
ncbi:MAG TPA: cell division protein FtsZ [Anaerolineales bacterium]|nr:cell division protein FtsZ [Anaerolineales bacterium]